MIRTMTRRSTALDSAQGRCFWYLVFRGKSMVRLLARGTNFDENVGKKRDLAGPYRKHGCTISHSFCFIYLILLALAGVLAERQGFEPWIPCGIHAFQACAFSHSAISPQSSNSLNLPHWERLGGAADPVLLSFRL